jgi:hypothetical protein
MPRPKLPTAEFRGNVLRIRLTDDERAVLDAAATGVGYETSTWARVVLLATATAVRQRAAKQARRKGSKSGERRS